MHEMTDRRGRHTKLFRDLASRESFVPVEAMDFFNTHIVDPVVSSRWDAVTLQESGKCPGRATIPLGDVSTGHPFINMQPTNLIGTGLFQNAIGLGSAVPGSDVSGDFLQVIPFDDASGQEFGEYRPGTLHSTNDQLIARAATAAFVAPTDAASADVITDLLKEREVRVGEANAPATPIGIDLRAPLAVEESRDVVPVHVHSCAPLYECNYTKLGQEVAAWL